MTHKQILDFISAIRDSFDGAEHVYTKGSCYQFFLILKSVVPKAQAYNNSDHVITKIGEGYYDITGEVNIENHLPVDGYYYSHEDLNNLKFRMEYERKD